MRVDGGGQVQSMGYDDKIKNKGQELRGQAKEAVGDATDNKRLRAEGQHDKDMGKLKQAGEHVKDAGRKVKDTLDD